MSMATVIEKPYAAVIASLVLKYNTTKTQPVKSIQLILGMYICPLISVGYFVFILGQNPRLIASLISVNEPLISAWLAIMDAMVARSTEGNKNHEGTIAKKGLIPVKVCLCCISAHAPCPR